MHSACGQLQRGNMSSKKKKSPGSHQKRKALQSEGQGVQRHGGRRTCAG